MIENDNNRSGSGSVFLRSGSKNFFLLLIILMFAFILIIQPVRNYFRELAHVNTLKEQLKTAENERTYYQGEVARWNDDKFVIAYAREHFALIMPGEMAWHVADPDVVGHDKDLNNFSEQRKAEIDQEIAQTMKKYKMPWYERLAGSLAGDSAPSSSSTLGTPQDPQNPSQAPPQELTQTGVVQ